MTAKENQKFLEDFVRAWQTSTHVNEVAEKLGISYFAATSLAARLRRATPPVPLNNLTKLKGPRLAVDGKRLAKIAQQPDWGRKEYDA